MQRKLERMAADAEESKRAAVEDARRGLEAELRKVEPHGLSVGE